MDRNASNEFPFFYLNFGLDFFFLLTEYYTRFSLTIYRQGNLLR